MGQQHLNLQKAFRAEINVILTRGRAAGSGRLPSFESELSQDQARNKGSD